MTAASPVFRVEPLVEILTFVDEQLAAGATVVELRVVDPDRGRGRYPGEVIDCDGIPHRHRPLRVWVDLAERRGLRLLTPRPAEPPLIALRFERLDPAGRWAPPADAAPTERYGDGSGFARLSKVEDPGFVLDLADALGRIALPPRPRILDLGVNTGDELALILQLAPALRTTATFVGVDHSASALAIARARFAGAQVELIEADVGALAAHELGRFDLVIAIGMLQSPGIDDRELLRRIVQDHLAPTGAVVLGVPNCRYVDGEVEYGARMKNFRQPELGLVMKDVAFYRKYLQQHDRVVYVTGKHYVLVTGVRAGDRAD